MNTNSLDSIAKPERKLKDAVSFINEEEKVEFKASVLSLAFTDVIEKLMEKNNLSKAELAKKLNTSKSYITQIFNGDKLINFKLIARLSAIFNVDFFFLYKNKDSHIHQNLYERKKIKYDLVLNDKVRFKK